MYIREKVIKFLKIKNIIFTVIGLFNIIVSVADIVSLITTYSDQLETVLHAKSFPQSVTAIVIGIVLLLIAYLSRKIIGDAYFFSNYFELDLNGYIKYADLAQVTGKSQNLIKAEIRFLRKFYMKKYELKVIHGEEQIELYSKTCTCECKNCGAAIEKRIYFTGTCPYCGSSDLFAKVITDNQFYSIENHAAKGENRAEFYRIQSLENKIRGFCAAAVAYSFVILLSVMAIVSNIIKYNNKDYLIEVLFQGIPGQSSFALIQKHILGTIIAFFVLFLFFLFLLYLMARRLKSACIAKECSEHISRSKKPFVAIRNMMDSLHFSDKKKTVKKMGNAIRRGYLKNCTFEVHDGILKIALAKKVVKDQCPSCGGAIIGAVDLNYKCRYCGNVIMDVVEKKEASASYPNE